MPDTSPQRRGSTDGFSLLEVVIAMAILAFGLLTLALMQMQALTQASAGRHTAEGARVARSYLEQVHRIPWSVLEGSTGAGWEDPAWAAADASYDTRVDSPAGGTVNEHTYNVQWQVTNVSTCLRDVQVRVAWQEEDVSAGKQLVLATRRYGWGDDDC